MQKVINDRNYNISITLYWGSDSKDVTEDTSSRKNNENLLDSNIVQLDIISTLSVPFFYGSFIYADSSTNSTLINLIDVPIIHGRVSMFMVNGTDMPGVASNPEPFGEEYFTEEIVITGIESVDTQNGEKVLVKFSFASDDILKFTANLKRITTFDKKTKNQEYGMVNSVITAMFGKAGLSDKFDSESLDANSKLGIQYINSANDTLITALDYVYRKIYDDNFKNANDCSYIRIRYNHTTHKYEQWKYEDVGTDKLIYFSDDMYERELRNIVTVDLGKKTEPNMSKGKITLGSSGMAFSQLENCDMVKYIDYNYVSNTFKTSKHEDIDSMLIDHDSDFDKNLTRRATVINKNSDKFKDIDYVTEYSTSRRNGSIYDVITDTIFNSNYYRVESNGSLGRKAGDEIFVQFSDSVNSMYETLKGDYLITAIDNRYIADNGGKPSFRSIMDVHRPFMYKDEVKREEVQ